MEYGKLSDNESLRHIKALDLHSQAEKVMYEMNKMNSFDELQNQTMGLLSRLQEYLHGTGEIICVDLDD
jgi:hypothetical protein